VCNCIYFGVRRTNKKKKRQQMVSTENLLYDQNEFRTFVFEEKKPEEPFPIWLISLTLLSIGILLYVADCINFWTGTIFLLIPLILTQYDRLKLYKWGNKEKIQGSFTGELRINTNEIVILENTYKIEEIKSLNITYDSFYGEKDIDYFGISSKNGETNSLKMTLKNYKIVEIKFKFASLDHAKKLLELTDLLKRRIFITNDWKLN